MIAKFMDRVHEWWDSRSALRELKRQKSMDAPYEAQEVGKMINRVTFAAFRDAADDGLIAYNELRMRAADIAITSANVLRALMHLKHYDTADAALVEAQAKFPGNEQLIRLHAELAQRQGRWDVAAERWALIRAQFPGNSGGYTFGAGALAQLGRYAEADNLLAQWIGKSSDDSMARALYAKTAEQMGDLPAAIERWRTMQAHVHDVQAWIGEAKCLAQLNRTDEAMTVLERARWLFQSSPLPIVEITLLVQEKGDDEETLRQWARVRSHFPAAPQAYIFAAWLLRKLDRLEEAEAILLRYVERDMGQPEPTVEYARFAHGRDWPEACRRWAIVRDKFPERHEGYTLGADALDAIGAHEEAATVRATPH